MQAEKTVKTWEKTRLQNLVRHKTGGYYARLYLNGKEIWKSLKAEGKTKNELFREMVEEVLGWGLAPALVTADSWYSGVENLRFLRDQGLSFMIALEKNRTVSEEPGEHRRVIDPRFGLGRRRTDSRLLRRCVAWEIRLSSARIKNPPKCKQRRAADNYPEDEHILWELPKQRQPFHEF